MASRTLDINPVAGSTFAATVNGVDVTRIDSASWAQVTAALDTHGVLVFPGQHLSPEAQAAFAKRFGAIEGGKAEPTGAPAPEAQRANAVDRARPISNRGSDQRVLTPRDGTWLTLSYPTRHWHMDGTFNPVPPKVCLLSAVSLPPGGSQTAFADLCAAHDALDAEKQGSLEGLHAYHSNLIGTTRVLPARYQRNLTELVGETPVDGYYGLGYRADAPLRPLVNRHPSTGRKVLFVGRHVFRVSGMSPEDSETFLQNLEREACRAPRIYEHDWRVGDLVVFDNRRTLHRAIPYDERSGTRILLNSRVVGDVTTDAGMKGRAADCSVEVQHDELVRLRRRVQSQ